MEEENDIELFQVELPGFGVEIFVDHVSQQWLLIQLFIGLLDEIHGQLQKLTLLHFQGLFTAVFDVIELLQE